MTLVSPLEMTKFSLTPVEARSTQMHAMVAAIGAEGHRVADNPGRVGVSLQALIAVWIFGSLAGTGHVMMADAPACSA